jgi:putative ABC transport system substrate-binding protein
MAGSAALWPVRAVSPPPSTVRVVGVAFGSVESDPEAQARAEAFRRGLRELGWTEGQNIRFEYRWMGNNPERARALAAELVALAPDVILSSGTVATVALHQAKTTIPVVFVNVTDPVAGGFVASLARPGGNMTGFTPFEYEIAGKWLELLRQTAPGLSRVALMGDPNNHNYQGFWRPFEQAARGFGVKALQFPARDAAEIQKEIAALASVPDSGLVVTAAIFSLVHRELIVDMAAKLKVPTIYWSRFFPQTGGLVSYGPNTDELHRRSADYIDRILKGARPSALPVQVATTYETVLNLKTAKALGLSISPQFFASVDDAIE